MERAIAIWLILYRENRSWNKHRGVYPHIHPNTQTGQSTMAISEQRCRKFKFWVEIAAMGSDFRAVSQKDSMRTTAWEEITWGKGRNAPSRSAYDSITLKLEPPAKANSIDDTPSAPRQSAAVMLLSESHVFLRDIGA